MDILRVTVFGGCDFRWQSRSRVELRSKKARALLTYLALQRNNRASREKLIGLLWSDRSEKQAYASLRQTLSHLRKVFDAKNRSPLIIEIGHVALDAALIDVDALRFDKMVTRGRLPDLEAAIAVYHGDFLDGFSLRDPAFEDWQQQLTRQYRENFLQVASQVFCTYVESGFSKRAVFLGERLLDTDPPARRHSSRPYAAVRGPGTSSQSLEAIRYLSKTPAGRARCFGRSEHNCPCSTNSP
jgi:DNA-binding SARP family transcriptional activator